MKERIYELRCRDGSRRYAAEWEPEEEREILGVIALVHGMGEHIGRYLHVADMFTRAGYAVFGFDQVGHGRTEGKRGHTKSYIALMDGVDAMLAETKRRYPDKPLFLYGHSMGGNVTLNYVLRRKPDIAGVIVTGPWLRLAFNPPPLQLIIARVVNRLFPSYTNDRPMVGDHLTSDPVMVKRYQEDELGHGAITARFFLSVQGAGLWALKHASEWRVPLLLMHGGSDKVTSILASRQFAEAAGSKCTFMEWPGLKHELHNELDREEVFDVARDWLEERLEEL
ncbi:alpha/beta hydrolase [Paenibacillus sacheonensis]|uniref:Alpha/beta fold hydrolase n=1 Tax=Paenibacillus sacheonensis TaxID=742054 RepID=A0A7X4YPN5_9BACL|nr:alpha/beta hydrolase [Paenibacillus sacheonensis]MBM7565033.1 alpha-beta hydrolase superfamily lysophospholipase [Paenibacillus sacheonensis]NBC70182.1 alpha/beta fold hydrolase [Paenibacillus sacheonensis]